MAVVSGARIVGVSYLESPNVGGALINPTLLVIHFTASGGKDSDGDAKYFQNRAAKASAHLVIGRDGSVTQCVRFDRKAWHAGVSEWRGRTNCNDFSIGIEVDNWGKLVKTGEGTFRPWTLSGFVESDDVAQLTHKNETAPAYWELYAQKQIDAVVEQCRAIIAAYPTITEIVGHDDIAPRRKTDPGPAFPMERVRSLVFGRNQSSDVVAPLTRTVNASALNLRGGPGVQYDKVGPALKRGQRVTVLLDEGEWSKIEVPASLLTKARVGYVKDEFLA